MPKLSFHFLTYKNTTFLAGHTKFGKNTTIPAFSRRECQEPSVSFPRTRESITRSNEMFSYSRTLDSRRMTDHALFAGMTRQYIVQTIY